MKTLLLALTLVISSSLFAGENDRLDVQHANQTKKALKLLADLQPGLEFDKDMNDEKKAIFKFIIKVSGVSYSNKPKPKL